MNNIDILEEELRKDILYQIDMQLYDEFNDKFCEINENLGIIYTYKDLEDIKQAESETERRLLRQAIENLIAENKELKEEKLKKSGIYEFNVNIEDDYIPKSKVKEKIEAILNLHYNEDLQMYVVNILQSLLGKE